MLACRMAAPVRASGLRLSASRPAAKAVPVLGRNALVAQPLVRAAIRGGGVPQVPARMLHPDPNPWGRLGGREGEMCKGSTLGGWAGRATNGVGAVGGWEGLGEPHAPACPPPLSSPSLRPPLQVHKPAGVKGVPQLPRRVVTVRAEAAKPVVTAAAVPEEGKFLGISTFTWQKIIPLGLMFFW